MLVPADLVEFSTNNEEMKLLIGNEDARQKTLIRNLSGGKIEDAR